jgi:glycine/D-amino acid oxidase-like deaminating enzyme
MTRVRTAVVIGGGIAGSVLALALHKAGIEATSMRRTRPPPRAWAARSPWPPTALPHWRSSMWPGPRWRRPSRYTTRC